MIQQNIAISPIVRRKSFWLGAVGSAIAASDLIWNNSSPREIRVFKGGNLNVTYTDGTTEILTGIPDGTIFVDTCWASISATSSTAYNLSFGW